MQYGGASRNLFCKEEKPHLYQRFWTDLKGGGGGGRGEEGSGRSIASQPACMHGSGP